MTVTGQPTVSYGYDNADRLTSITQSSAVVGFTYDNADRRTVLSLPNGIAVEYAYDAASQLTGLTYKLGSTTLGDLIHTYDLAGNRTSVGGTWARTGLPTALSLATYDAANQIATWASTSFTYDANGNLTNDGTKTYTWNARNQLTGLSGGVSASFQYDGLGRRRARTVSGSTTVLLHDGINTVQELTGGSPSANIVSSLAIDEWLTRTDSSGARHFLTDALGSTVALANSSGGVVTEYTSQPFGQTITSGSSSTNPFQFTGRENDGTELMYYRARYFAPTLQRFTAEDPIEFESGDTNLHTYVTNAPVTGTDPLGLEVVIFGRNPMMIRPGHGWRPMPGQRFNPRPIPRTTPGRDPTPTTKHLPTEPDLTEPTNAPPRTPVGPRRWTPNPPDWLKKFLRKRPDLPELPNPTEPGMAPPVCGRKCPPPPPCDWRQPVCLS